MVKESPSSARRPRERSKREVQSIRALAAICFAVIVLILVVPGIRRAPFAQGVAGLVMALLVAVVIFVLFPAPARIKLPLSLVTASGFYLALLPRIRPFIFPIGTLTGEVRYEGTSQAVVDAEVRLMGAPPTKTNEYGAFTLTNVRSDVTELIIHYQLFDTTVVVNDRGLYPVVPKYQAVRSTARPIDAGLWVERVTHRCATVAPQRGRMRMFVLNDTLAGTTDEWSGKQVSGRTFHLRVRPTGAAEIAVAEVRDPDQAARLDINLEGKAWHWYVNDPPSQVPTRIEICVERGPNVGAAPVELTYWLEGTERVRAGPPQ